MEIGRLADFEDVLNELDEMDKAQNVNALYEAYRQVVYSTTEHAIERLAILLNKHKYEMLDTFEHLKVVAQGGE